MKSTLKLTLLLAAVMTFTAAGNAYGQKFGFVDFGELIYAMPEVETIDQQLMAYNEELTNMLETIQVEYNNKYLDLQKNLSTYSDSVRQLKEKELNDLQQRFSEFQVTAQQDMQRKQNELYTPVLEKARTAIEKVGAANGVTAVFDLSAGAIIYHNPADMLDLLPLVKTELGIQ